ncbi:MAG: ATP-binding protein [bacterium]
MKILIADDDLIIHDVLKKAAEDLGYEPIYVTDGFKAWKWIEKDEDIRICIIDWMMPVIDGTTLCQRIREYMTSHYLYIILLTSKAKAGDIVSGLKAGADDYIVKPFYYDELKMRILTGERIINLEDKLLWAHRDLEKEQKRLVEMIDFKNKILGIAAHDLRNPLVSIRGFAELLHNKDLGELNDDQEDLAETIYTISSSMLSLLNDLLDVSIIESGKLRLEIGPNNLTNAIAQVVHLNRITAKKKNIDIKSESKEIPETLLFDAKRIKQVLDNLINNAIKFSPPNLTIWVSTEMVNNKTIISVKDQGQGIPLNEQNKLFQDLGRTSVQPTDGESSTGLGLAICKKIMDAHNGTIIVNSEPGKGSEFIVSF